MKKVQILIFIIAFICFIGSAGYLGNYFYQRYISSKNMDAVKTLIVEEDASTTSDPSMTTAQDGKDILLKYSKLYEKNSDFAGWIHIPGTTIDYPVMYVADDNETYLHANFEKEWDGGGTPFIDGHCALNPVSDNLIIYGHNMNDKSMFQPLMNYKDYDFYTTHKEIQFDTVDELATYEIVAVVLSRALADDEEGFRYYGYIDFGNEHVFHEYWNGIKQLSLYETEALPVFGDHLITLSTCEYSQEEGRLAVIARKITEGDN